MMRYFLEAFLSCVMSSISVNRKQQTSHADFDASLSLSGPWKMSSRIDVCEEQPGSGDLMSNNLKAFKSSETSSVGPDMPSQRSIESEMSLNCAMQLSLMFIVFGSPFTISFYKFMWFINNNLGNFPFYKTVTFNFMLIIQINNLSVLILSFTTNILNIFSTR